MQFYLADSTVPIRLYSASTAPRPQQQQHAPTRKQLRPVPGHPYIHFVDDDDTYDGSYPFDAFQDLRSAYGASPLASLQHRMCSIQQQRAATQLQRQLLEQQLREHAQRERDLLRYQQALAKQRKAHVRAAAEQARRAYLARLATEERDRVAAERKKMDDRGFVPPFHFFSRILDGQMRSQDDVERRRAQKIALNGMLDEYFAPPKDVPNVPEKAAERTPSPPQPSSALPAVATGDVQKSPGFGLEPSVLDSVLKIVHRRLNEIAAQEEEASSQEEAPSSPATPAVTSSEPSKQEPASEDAPPAEQKGIEIEEPIDYTKLANILRKRVNTLDDVNTFVPQSPPLGHLGATADLSPPPSPSPMLLSPVVEKKEEEEGMGSAMHVDKDAAEHTDSEFAGLMNDCKAQLKELQSASAAAAAADGSTSTGKRRQRRSRRRPRHRSRHHESKLEEEAESAVAPLAESADDAADIAAQRQQAAVNTIEDHILGARNARKAKAALTSLRQLQEIELELDAIRAQYNQLVQDTQLSFVADKSGGLKLAYGGENRPFLMYQEVLQRLLARLDEIPSHGDEVVRARRKAVVVKIQDTLDALDQFAADQESELTESSVTDILADESSNGD